MAYRGSRPTFRSIVETAAIKNQESLMMRARIATRLAKSLKGHARDHLYRVKVELLLALSIRFPNRVTITADPRLPGFVLIALLPSPLGLHAPAEVFCQSWATSPRPAPLTN